MNKALKSKIILKFGTQDDFAARIGVNRSVVSNVVQNRRKLSFQQKVLWATVLGCAVDDIFPADHQISETDSGNTPYNSDSASNQKEDSTYEN
jgi:transcriptional regulator with XRE-family HTH domain